MTQIGERRLDSASFFVAMLLAVGFYANTLINTLVAPQWKQAIWVIVLPFVARELLRRLARWSVGSGSLVIFCIALVFVLSYPYLFCDPEQSVWYLYEFVGFVYLVFFFQVLPLMAKHQLARFFAVIASCAAVSSIGVLIQFSSGYSDAMIQSLSSNPEDLGRPSFLLGSSSLLFAAYALPILLYSILSSFFGYRKPFFILCYCILSVAGALLSGSRSSFLLYLSLVCSFVFWYVGPTLGRGWAWGAFASIACASVVGFDFIGAERFAQVLQASDAGNVARFHYWSMFVEDISQGVEAFGEGIGYLKARPDAFGTVHFESSFLSIYYQVGIFGLVLVFFLPLVVVLSFRGPKIIKLYIVLFYLQSMAAPTFFNYFQMMVFGVALSALSLSSSASKRYGRSA